MRQKLDDGKVVVGALATNHIWHDLVEVAIDAGLDYLIVDLEHGPHDASTVAQVCQLGRVAGFAVLIRTAANDFRRVGFAMDLGPCGLVLASVETPDQLDEVRDAIYMPPRGRRRPGGAGNRWVDDYHLQTWQKRVEDDVIVIPQIETRTGLEHADALAAHEIVTAIGIGPYDLSMSVGANMDWDHAEFVAAVDKVHRAADTAGKPMWRLGDPAQLVQQGYQFICLGVITSVLTEALRQKVRSAHSTN
jgi:2-keto-3-deoxy-L-rhamnonate aldolase RhmA